MSGGPQVLTFGCRLNAYESEVMRGHAQAAGDLEATTGLPCAASREAGLHCAPATTTGRAE